MVGGLATMAPRAGPKGVIIGLESISVVLYSMRQMKPFVPWVLGLEIPSGVQAHSFHLIQSSQPRGPRRYRDARPMNQQMSFDFLPDAAAPGRAARAAHRRTASPRLPPVQLPLQLSLVAADGGTPARPPVAPRPPVFRTQASLAPLGDGRQWSEGGWTASVIRNLDGDGWAVQVRRNAESEPVLLAPWATERDGPEPKPLDQAAFNALVRTAAGTLERQVQQLHASLHKRVALSLGGCRWEVTLDVVPDEYEPHALLAAIDGGGERVAHERVLPDFKLTAASAQAWIEAGFRQAGGDLW